MTGKGSDVVQDVTVEIYLNTRSEVLSAVSSDAKLAVYSAIRMAVARPFTSPSTFQSIL